ncbi:MAG TPA: hypothetical protein VMS21_07785, partial [Methylomirabilota bacterium]|nr:hypothetical protein [Methylomirabilota bacterium]
TLDACSPSLSICPIRSSEYNGILMSRSRKTLLASVIVVTLLLVAAWQQGWFGEPAHNGRTVTEWLDQLELPKPEVTSGGRLTYAPRSPEVIRNDPALQSLMAIGPEAVPVLIKIINAPVNWPEEIGRWERIQRGTKYRWSQVRGASPSQRDRPHWTEKQLNRKQAAVFALIVLGRHPRVGFSRFLEPDAAPLVQETIYGTKLDYPTLSLSFTSPAVERAKTVYPEIEQGLFDAIQRGLKHTNPMSKIASMDAALALSRGNPAWKEPLVRLTGDTNHRVQIKAMWALGGNYPDDHALILRTMGSVLEDRRNPTQARVYAVIALKGAGTRALPVLRNALNDPDEAVRLRIKNYIQLIEEENPAR